MPSDHVVVTSTTDSEEAARTLAAEIIATPITGGSADYLSWLVDETRG